MHTGEPDQLLLCAGIMSENSWTAVQDLDGAEWFVLLSNLAFLSTAWFCVKRYQWLRALLFALTCCVNVAYHSHEDTDVFASSDRTLTDLFRICANYRVVSTLMLLAHFQSQGLELLVEGGAAAMVSIMVAVFALSDAIVVTSGCVIVVALVVMPSWWFGGPVPNRFAWTVSGFGIASLVLISSIAFGEDDLWAVGSNYIMISISTSCFVYSFRDPNLLRHYIILGDILQ